LPHAPRIVPALGIAQLALRDRNNLQNKNGRSADFAIRYHPFSPSARIQVKWTIRLSLWRRSAARWATAIRWVIQRESLSAVTTAPHGGDGMLRTWRDPHVRVFTAVGTRMPIRRRMRGNRRAASDRQFWQSRLKAAGAGRGWSGAAIVWRRERETEGGGITVGICGGRAGGAGSSDRKYRVRSGWKEVVDRAGRSRAGLRRTRKTDARASRK